MTLVRMALVRMARFVSVEQNLHYFVGRDIRMVSLALRFVVEYSSFERIEYGVS